MVKNKSGRISCLYNRGLISEKLRNFEQALEDFNAALELEKSLNADNKGIIIFSSSCLLLGYWESGRKLCTTDSLY